MKAIIFEDEDSLALLITTALNDICPSVFRAATLAEFKEHRASMKDCPGLVWMDLRAIGNTPQDVFNEIREIRSCCPHAIIVVMTGMRQEEVQQPALDAGADWVSFKPCQITTLDLAQTICSGAINAMKRDSNNGPIILEGVCRMAIRYFQSR